MNRERRREGRQAEERIPEAIPGIVIAAGRSRGTAPDHGPRIHAFVWGGKVRQSPILPYGRWKGGS